MRLGFPAREGVGQVRKPVRNQVWGVLLVGGLGLGACGPRPPPPAYPPPIPAGGAVFFVGNSFFGWGTATLPQRVAVLGSAVDPPVPIVVGQDIVFGDAPLRSFLTHAATREALASRSFDVFVLQGHELEVVDDKAAFHQTVRDFQREIEASGARTVLFMTWDFPWRPFIDEVAASYDAIGRELQIPVIPAGLVYEDCRRTPFAGQSQRWLTASPELPAGDLHPNDRGGAVNAYATFATLTGRDPGGARVDGEEGVDASGEVELRRYLSDTAWARVAPRLRTAAPSQGTP